jgi:hypothetical protein
MSKKPPSFEWFFWLQWMLVSGVGWLVGWLAGEMGIGAGVGLVQWLVLRPRVPRAGWWIPASAVGWAVGVVAVLTVFPPETGIWAGTALGAAMGVGQALVLSYWGYRGAGWWVIASALGWAVGLGGVLGASLVGVAAGAVTGIVLELMLRTQRPRP